MSPVLPSFPAAAADLSVPCLLPSPPSLPFLSNCSKRRRPSPVYSAPSSVLRLPAGASPLKKVAGDPVRRMCAGVLLFPFLVTASWDLSLHRSFHLVQDLQIKHLPTRLSLKMEQQNDLEQILEGNMKPTRLPLETLRTITDNFSRDRIIGEGGFGTVYKGIIGNRNIAVKKIRSNMTINQKLFHHEVGNQMDVNHENVVRFLGLCSHTVETPLQDPESRGYILAEIRERLLCFEYVSNGSLDTFITDEYTGLDWDTRYKIIKGICTGLYYLHMEKQILHMDLKPTNILLDNQMVPKITDFGLSRPMENAETITASNFSSLGYAAPENICGRRTKSVKSDIFSLGAIIIELLTGCKDTPGNNNILRWSQRWRESAEETPLEYYEQLTECIEIGSLCRNDDPDARPSIAQIMTKFVEMENTMEKRAGKAAEKQQRTDNKVEVLTMNLDQMTNERQCLEEDMRKAAENQQSCDKKIELLTMKLDQMTTQERERLAEYAGKATEEHQMCGEKIEVLTMKLDQMTRDKEGLEEDVGKAAEKQQRSDKKIEVLTMNIHEMTQEREHLEEDARKATEKQQLTDESIEVLTMKLDQMNQERKRLEEDEGKAAEKQQWADEKIEALMMKLDEMTQERLSLDEDGMKAAEKQQRSDKKIEVLTMKFQQMTQERDCLKEDAGKAAKKQQSFDEKMEALMIKLDQMTQEREILKEDACKATEKQQMSNEQIEVLTRKLEQMTQESERLEEDVGKAAEKQQRSDEKIEILTIKLDKMTHEKHSLEKDARKAAEQQQSSDKKIEILKMNLDQMTQKGQRLEEDARKAAEKQQMCNKAEEVLTTKLDQMTQERRRLEERVLKANEDQLLLTMKLDQRTQRRRELEIQLENEILKNENNRSGN